MRKLMGFLLIIFTLCSSAKAEYRVFLLRISKAPANTQTAPSQGASSSELPSAPNSRDPASAPLDYRLVESTLDPIQYRGYYLVGADEKVEYIDTWMCKGRTDQFASLCPNPKAQIPAE